MSRTEGRTDAAPAPAGPFSQSVRIGTLVAAAGQVGNTPDGEVLEGVGPQTRQALANVASVLAASGATMEDVLTMRVFLTDTAHFAEMNEVYAEAFAAPYPTRTTVYVGLPTGLLVEIDALAVVASSS
jgi:2-iminobutanoate/2-iminopropanoate deaminase